MGDLIHTLPALSDAKNALKDVKFDWVTDPAFAEIPRWHPTVNQIIPAPLRQWRKQKIKSLRNGSVKQFRQMLRQTKYDFIIDAQSALKSALIARLARGRRAGMDKNSVREYGAHWFYADRYPIAKDQHAIKRLRTLFANTLGYSHPENQPDFGIDRTQLPKSPIELPEKYILIVHSTTWKTKHWPETHWQELIKHITGHGLPALLPWANENEKQRAERLAAGNKNVIVLPKMTLSECGTVINKATAAIAVDTGLGHLCAALEIPTIHLYGPTDPNKIGAHGKNQMLLTAKFPCAPCYLKNCNYNTAIDGKPVCYSSLPADLIWNTLQNLLSKQY